MFEITISIYYLISDLFLLWLYFCQIVSLTPFCFMIGAFRNTTEITK